MAWTLYRYILRELLKVLLLTTVVLVVIMSFGAAIRPISDGLLSPVTLVKFVLYTIPTVVGFVLPFAGAFASTVVFSRMAQDNEVLACCASGMSYRRLLLPVFALGVALTLGLFVLGNTVVPGFYRGAKSIIKSDVITALVAQLNQNKPFNTKAGYVLYADGAEVFEPSEVPALRERGWEDLVQKVVSLRGVAVGRLGGEAHMPLQDFTAEKATVLVADSGDRSDTSIFLTLQNAVYFDSSVNNFLQLETMDFGSQRLPNPLSDDIKFFSGRQLAELGQHPERYDRVRLVMDNLTQALATERLRQAMIAQLAKSGGVRFNGTLPGESYTLRAPAPRIVGDRLVLSATPRQRVVVERYSNLSMEPDRVFSAVQAAVDVQESPFADDLVINIELTDVAVEPGGTQQPTWTVPNLTWPEPIFTAETSTPGYEELRDLARSLDYAASEPVQQYRQKLYDEFLRLDARIKSQRHTRVASAIASALLLLLGALLSIHLKAQMPLVVFFWSFVLAIVTIILINTGENLASGTGLALGLGLGTLWLGNVALTIIAGVVYCQVAKH